MSIGASVLRRPNTRGLPSRPQPAPAQKMSWTAKMILLVFLLTIFEGAIRKWFVGTIPVLRYSVYFSKDLVFVLAALPALSRLGRLGQFAFGTLLPISLALLAMPTLINIGNSNLVGVVLSVRAYLVLP